MNKIWYLGLLALLWIAKVEAAAPPEFSDSASEQRYLELIEEIRCLVCQNQSLADSNAGLAQDLRAEIHRMIEAGQGDEQIIEFLVRRYGDFVLYRPPLKGNTWLLWFGPFLLLAGALAIAVILIRRQARARPADKPLNAAEQERLRQLLGSENAGRKD